MKFLFALLALSHSVFAQINISEARKMKSGKIVTVNGHVTATFGDLSFIQDHSSAIAIYGVNVEQDDSVRITGKLSKFNGLLEIVSDSIKILASNLASIKPRLVTSLTDHEAELIQLLNITFPATKLFFYPSRPGILFNNSDSIQYWIDENTDIPGYSIPISSNITGIVSRYETQFQLMPRSHSDIENATPEQPTGNNNFKVLNWNLEFFGAPKYGPTNNDLQLTNVARVLNSTHADLMALQEISSDDAFRKLIQVMPGYNGRCSNRYSYSFDPSDDFPPQKVCFVYNTSTVKVIREKILFAEYFDNHPSDIFSSGRLPYLLEVETMGHRLNFVNIHAKSGYDNDARNRRILDAQMLKDTLDVYYPDDVILVGDFNDVLESSYEKFLSDPKYNCITKPLSDQGWHSTVSYDDVIDHQVISSSINENYLNTKVVNVFFLIPLYGKTTSDHLPVISEFDLTKMVTGLTRYDGIKVFPNPTGRDIWFTSDNPDVVIVNSLGSIIYQNKNAHPPISLNEYAPGFYTVIIDGHAFKIIKN